MPVVWDATKVEKWDEVDPVLKNSIDFMLMEAGFGTITEDNVREVFDRISFAEKVHGAYRVQWDEEKSQSTDFYLTPDEIRMLIGYNVNVPKMPIATFRANLWKRHVESNNYKWKK